jgi:hypothetical protein
MGYAHYTDTIARVKPPVLSCALDFGQSIGVMDYAIGITHNP